MGGRGSGMGGDMEGGMGGMDMVGEMAHGMCMCKCEARMALKDEDSMEGSMDEDDDMSDDGMRRRLQNNKNGKNKGGKNKGGDDEMDVPEVGGDDMGGKGGKGGMDMSSEDREAMAEMMEECKA